MRSIFLRDLLSICPPLSVEGNFNQSIDFITADSRRVTIQSLFVAVKGTHRNGHDFIMDAYSKGVRAFVVESKSDFSQFSDAVIITVASTREFLDQALCYYYENPSKDLVCIGVTGTNGKTTITHLIECMLNQQNLLTAVMGTIDHHIGNKKYDTDLTTPDPELLQKRVFEFKNEGAKVLAMEVSSHALHQRRADSIQFDIAIFSNLTRDHLDYHGSMQDYFTAKQRLFDDLLWKSSKFDRFSIINADDFYGKWLKSAPNTKILYYGMKKADFLIRPRLQALEGMEFAIEYSNKKIILKSKMIGLHNLYNLTAAFAVGAALNLDLEACARALERYPGVSGRLERVENSKGIHVFVDYAHTDDALKNVLESLRAIRDSSSPQSKLITVFGCGGDRDRGKRPIMAKVAESCSDLVVVTSDNPRTETPSLIIDEIIAGFSESYSKTSVRNEVDRERAIGLALSHARKGDVVIIAGKGHEDYQILGKTKIHFNDVEVVRKLI